MTEWISVNDHLPEHGGSYLVCTENSKAFITHFWERDKRFSHSPKLITHWAELPETPYGGKNRF